MKKGSQIGHKSVTDTMCTDAICTAVVMAWYNGRGSTSISWESVYNISCSWVDVLVFTSFYLSRVSCLMRFRNGSDKGTASNFHENHRKCRETLAMIRQAFREESMSCTEKVQTRWDRKMWESWGAKSRACSSLSLILSGLFTKNLFW
jgi:hypothetical protein